MLKKIKIRKWDFLKTIWKIYLTNLCKWKDHPQEIKSKTFCQRWKLAITFKNKMNIFRTLCQYSKFKNKFHRKVMVLHLHNKGIITGHHEEEKKTFLTWQTDKHLRIHWEASQSETKLTTVQTEHRMNRSKWRESIEHHNSREELPSNKTTTG